LTLLLELHLPEQRKDLWDFDEDVVDIHVLQLLTEPADGINIDTE
jgi:hypothetical protein